jgi:arylsulfatase A-like enzyme
MMDITPTLLNLLGVPIPGHMEGQSLLPVIQGSELAESRPIFSEMAGETDTDGVIYWLAPHTNLYSVKKDGWKIIHAERVAQADELYLVQPASLYEEESLTVQEAEKADQLFQELQDRFGIPTEFLYLPVLERK